MIAFRLKGGDVTTKLDRFFIDQGLRPTDTLAHWGIKGMKWGIRRSDDQLARLSGGQTEASDAARARQTQQTISKAKSLAAVGDSDLNHLINRINTERRYTEAKVNSSALAKSQSKIKTILNVGDTMNRAVSFNDSKAGRILAGKLGFTKPSTGKHTATAVAAAALKKKK